MDQSRKAQVWALTALVFSFGLAAVLYWNLSQVKEMARQIVDLQEQVKVLKSKR